MTADGFKTILVAIDGSPESAAGLEKAIRLAAFEGAARLQVVAVLEPPFPLIGVADAGPLEVAKEYQSQDAYLTHHLERAKERLRAAGFETQPELHRGSAKATIVDRAKAIGADLIVIGGPCHGLWECGLRGCTACWVVRYAPCSVLVVRTTQNREPSHSEIGGEQ